MLSLAPRVRSETRATTHVNHAYQMKDLANIVLDRIPLNANDAWMVNILIANSSACPVPVTV